MKPALITIVICAFAPAAWTQRAGVCAVKPAPQAFEAYCQALETDARNSLAHYRIAEPFAKQNDWQSSANEYREVLQGNLDPKWTEVWAHIRLGIIFSNTGQRDRALNEYQQARRTGDNAFGAQDEITRLLGEMNVKVKPLPRFLDPRERAQPVEMTPAEYTEEARVAELEGIVLLEGVIGEDGSARDVTVVRPFGLGLDESAMAAVRQWRFVRGSDTQAGSNRSVIAVDFFLSSKASRWHLVRSKIDSPPGAFPPTFLTAHYPEGAGLFGAESIEEGRLLSAVGRQATATVSFEVDELGLPVNLRVEAMSAATWGPEALALVSGWRFKPAVKDGKAVSVPCAVDLVWGPRKLTARIVESLVQASVGQEIGQR